MFRKFVLFLFTLVGAALIIYGIILWTQGKEGITYFAPRLATLIGVAFAAKGCFAQQNNKNLRNEKTHAK